MGNSRPKLYPAFGHCPQRFIFFKAVKICYEDRGCSNQMCPFTVFLGKKCPFISLPDTAFNF